MADLRTATTRTALVAQLGLNLLFIAGNNLGFPARLDGFMDQSTIRRSTDSDDGTLSGIVQGGAILNLESEGIGSTTQFKLRNTGATQLLFALSTAPDTMPATALGPFGSTFLNAQNLSADFFRPSHVTGGHRNGGSLKSH
ncbi:MAG: hypothetical protein HY842_11975 [Bacteroidetes bacterium]|nr:hypothetical protein [Bacteroidota bacterium]